VLAKYPDKYQASERTMQTVIRLLSSSYHQLEEDVMGKRNRKGTLLCSVRIIISVISIYSIAIYGFGASAILEIGIEESVRRI
jgi:hypothetical protein